MPVLLEWVTPWTQSHRFRIIVSCWYTRKPGITNISDGDHEHNHVLHLVDKASQKVLNYIQSKVEGFSVLCKTKRDEFKVLTLSQLVSDDAVAYMRKLFTVYNDILVAKGLNFKASIVLNTCNTFHTYTQYNKFLNLKKNIFLNFFEHFFLNFFHLIFLNF